MILGAALLVLVALGLFVGGIATGATAFYWACVALSVLAAVLLFVARRRMGAAQDDVPADGRPGRPNRPDRPAEAEVEPAREPEPAATHESETHHRPGGDADDGVAGPEQDLPAGRVSGFPAGVAEERPDGAALQPPGAPLPADDGGEPPVEEVEVTDLLLVVDLRDEVLVVDEHPRYHLDGCPWLAGRTAVPLPLDEARTDGFTPCGRCAPDRHLAAAERDRRAGGRAT